MQRLSVFPSRFPSSHDSSRSLSRYSSAQNSHWMLIRNVSVFLSRLFAWISSCDSFIFSSCDSFAWISPRDSSTFSSHDSSARISSSDSFWSSSYDSSIKSCLFMKNLYVMFHKLSELNEKEHMLQSQRQRVFLELTYSVSFFISVSSSCSLKRFLQRSKMKSSF